MRSRLSISFLCLALAGHVLGASSKLSPELQRLDPNANVRVIVQYAVPPTTAAPTTSTPAQGAALLGGIFGLANGLLSGVVNLAFTFVKGVVYTGPVSSLNAVANNPNVTYISLDRPLSGKLDYTAAAVNANVAWQANLTGSGIGIAVIDSGVDATGDLKNLGLFSRVTYTQDFTGGNGTDQYGHGTHVAGILAASGSGSHCFNCTRSLVGIAPSANIINLRVLDANGNGTDSSVISAIETAIALKQKYNIRVINLSLGRPIYESYTQDPLCQAVEAAWKAGIVVVVAAGNDGRDDSAGNNGYGTIGSPGNDPYVITVGAMKAMSTFSRNDDLIASYSSKGPTAIDHIVKPDIVAPGNHVVSLLAPGSTLAASSLNTVPLSYYQSTFINATSTQYLMLNGTSMATPVVSGAVADMLQGQPALTPDQVKARLMKTAYKTFPKSSTAVDPVTGQTFTSQYDMMTIGAGYLDIGAALADKELATGNAMSPTASYDSASGKVSLVYNSSSTWDDTAVHNGQSIGGNAGVWGTQTVWGSSVVDANRNVWGANTVWGNSSASGFSGVWGTQGIYGVQTVWGSSTASANSGVWGTNSSTSDSDVNFTVQP